MSGTINQSKLEILLVGALFLQMLRHPREERAETQI